MTNEFEHQRDELRRELNSMMRVLNPGIEHVEFAEGFDSDIDPAELSDVIRAIAKMERRLTGPFRWFWRIWYRPRAL